MGDNSILFKDSKQNKMLSAGADDIQGIEIAGISDTTPAQDAYALHATQIKYLKDLLDQKGVDFKELQNKIKFVQDLIAEINTLIDENNGLDISNHAELQHKIKLAADMGIHIPKEQQKFSRFQTDRLIENLNRHLTNWDLDCKTHLNKLEKIVKEYDQATVLLKNLIMTLKRTGDVIINNIKNG